jgi:hypothetical protein
MRLLWLVVFLVRSTLWIIHPLSLPSSHISAVSKTVQTSNQTIEIQSSVAIFHVLMVCVLVLTRPPDCSWPHNYNGLLGKGSNFNATTVHRVESERALLSLLLTLLFRADPDLLVGHDIANFDLPTLLFRLSAHKVENWSRIGRLKRSGTLQHQAVSNAFSKLSIKRFHSKKKKKKKKKKKR